MELPETTKDIKADWLNQALRENGFLTDANIVSIEREQIGIGQGFQSDMARLKLTYDHASSHLPGALIAKLPTSHPPVREIALKRNLYERENLFYTEIAPASPIRTPGLIYTAADSKNKRYVLLMEDCSYAAPADPELQGLTYEQTKAITLKMADFHARWWDDDKLSSLLWMPKHKGVGAFPSIGIFRMNWEICARSEQFRAMLPEGGLQAGQKLYDKYEWLVENEPDNNLTIRHNDIRADNIFIDPNKPDDPLIFLDWGMASIGRGAADLAFTLGFSVTTSQRRQNEKALVMLYYERICAKGISGYTFEECWHDYLRGFLLLTTILAGQFAATDHSDPRGTRLVKMALNRWFTAILDNDAVKALPD